MEMHHQNAHTLIYTFIDAEQDTHATPHADAYSYTQTGQYTDTDAETEQVTHTYTGALAYAYT